MKANQIPSGAMTVATLALLWLPVANAVASRPDDPPRQTEKGPGRTVVTESALVTDLVKRAQATGRSPSELLSETGIQMQRRGRFIEATVLLRGALSRAPTDAVLKSRLDGAERARLRAAEELDRRADVALTQLRFNDALRESQKALQLLEPSESLYVRASARVDAARERLNLAKPAPQVVPSEPLRGAPETHSESPRAANGGAKTAQSPRPPTASAKRSARPRSIEPVPNPDIVEIVIAALKGGEFDRAAALVEQALITEPNRLALPALQKRVFADRRRAAEEVAAAAAQRDEAGDRRGALAAYARARSIDTALPGVDDAVGRIRESMRAAATSALTCAHVYEAKQRVHDAVSCYQRAIENMADDDPERKEALRRLERLVEQGEEAR